MTEDEFRKGGLPNLPMIIAELKGLLIKHTQATPEALDNIGLHDLMAWIDGALVVSGKASADDDPKKPLYDELATLRTHAVSLYEVMTKTEFGPGNEATPTEAILGHLVITARALLDGNDNLRQKAVEEVIELRRQLQTVLTRSDKVIGHLGEALALYARGPGIGFDDTSNKPVNEGMTPPP